MKGPLLGVLSAHLANQGKDLFLLACDLLLMERCVLGKLIEARVFDSSFEAYVFKKDEQQEPLCGIYTSAGLKKILLMLEQGKLTRYSMKFILSNLKVFEINVEDTLPNQKQGNCEIKDIQQMALREGLAYPAIIIIGDVVNAREIVSAQQLGSDNSEMLHSA